MKITLRRERADTGLVAALGGAENAGSLAGVKDKSAKGHALPAGEQATLWQSQLQMESGEMLHDAVPQFPEPLLVIGEEQEVICVAGIGPVVFFLRNPVIKGVEDEVSPKRTGEVSNGQSAWAGQPAVPWLARISRMRSRTPGQRMESKRSLRIRLTFWRKRCNFAFAEVFFANEGGYAWILFVILAAPSTDLPLSPRLRKLLDGICELANAQESGLAETPLSRMAHSLLEGGETRPLTILILGLEESARRAVLESLMGGGESRHPLCQVIVPPRVTIIEVQLHEHGFMVDDGQERRQFSEPEAFLRALEAVDRSPESAVATVTQPLRLTLAAARGCAGTALLLPDSLETLRRRPELLSLMADRADLLLLCGGAEEKLPAEDRELLTTLATGVPALQCVVTSTESLAAPPSWTRSHAFAVNFSTTALLEAGSEASLPAFSAENRAALLRLRLLRDAENCLAILDATVQREQHLSAGKKRYHESTQQTGLQADDGRLRNVQDSASSAVGSRLKLAQQRIDDSARAWLAPAGHLHTELAAMLKELQVSDLLHEDEGEKTLLSLQPASLNAMREKVRAATMAFVAETTAATRKATEDATAAAAAVVEPANGQPVRLEAPTFDPSRLLTNLAPGFLAPVKYRGEVPQLTRGRLFFSIFQAPMIYGTLMMLLQAFNWTIAADMTKSETFQKIRFIGSAIILPMVIIMPFYTKKKIARERAAAFRKELERVRDGVGGEMERIAARAVDELKRTVAEHFAAAGQVLAKEVERALKGVALKFQDDAKGRQKLASSLIQGLDRHIRDLQPRQQTCSRLKVDLAALRSEALGAFSTGGV